MKSIFLMVKFVNDVYRFGPGLVIYWFGYLETIVNSSEKRFIVRDHLPTNIIHITNTFSCAGLNDDSLQVKLLPN